MTHEEYKEELQKNVQKLHSWLNQHKEYKTKETAIAFNSCSDLLKYIQENKELQERAILFKGKECEIKPIGPIMHGIIKYYHDFTPICIGELCDLGSFPVFIPNPMTKRIPDKTLAIWVPDIYYDELMSVLS